MDLYFIFISLLSLLMFENTVKQEVDMILHNGIVYTVDDDLSSASAVVVDEGKIVAVGNSKTILNNYTSQKEIDLEQKPVYPGFIDAHCHFLGYGLGLRQLDLTGTSSFEEILELCRIFSENSSAFWIRGRGWDQNDWDRQEFPSKDRLDLLFPNNPVYLKRIDGHAAIANSKALAMAGINSKTSVKGGQVLMQSGEPNGILIDNAMNLVENVIPPASNKEKEEGLLSAQKNCFAVGLTTLSDAGLGLKDVFLIKELQEKGKMKIRLYIMLTPDTENKSYFGKNGPLKSERLNVRSFKYYSDGALGSRGAFLLEYYDDQPGHKGLILEDTSFFSAEAKWCKEHNFQMNTHCIGDAANRLILDLYGRTLGEGNKGRWRIEHAQIVNPEDLDKFNRFQIIPSVQFVHATSDMYWAEARLGKDRLQHAYAYKSLMENVGILANGSDFPVESINPVLGFYAGVYRQDLKEFPKDGFQIEEALSREDALRSMTIWAAYANFEEKEKGSLEKGKMADMVVLDRDIMKVGKKEIPQAKVLMTIINGEIVYSK